MHWKNKSCPMLSKWNGDFSVISNWSIETSWRLDSSSIWIAFRLVLIGITIVDHGFVGFIWTFRFFIAILFNFSRVEKRRPQKAREKDCTDNIDTDLIREAIEEAFDDLWGKNSRKSHDHERNAKCQSLFVLKMLN